MPTLRFAPDPFMSTPEAAFVPVPQVSLITCRAISQPKTTSCRTHLGAVRRVGSGCGDVTAISGLTVDEQADLRSPIGSAVVFSGVI